LLTASDLLRQGRTEELWQKFCGFLDLDISQFMEIQESLLLKQLELLNNSKIGKKLFRGKSPHTLEEFRRTVQLTSYKDYIPELSEKREDVLPAKPEMWAHSSGRSGDYPYKWIPLTREYIEHLSVDLYGIGMLSCARYRGDTSRIPPEIKLLYSVAPRPYISGTFADVLRLQSPFVYLPSLEEAEKMTYEDRISLGFQQALYKGLDYFFGLSLVLVKVGEKISDNSKKINIRPYLKHPRGLLRLIKGLIKSKIAGRPIMPKDIWDIKGIIGSGIDSWVYKQKIKELWGKNSLDIYSCTEGSVIATQAWDYEGMTFFPDLNFLEFIPEEEQVKLQMDRTYIPKTLLLNEVKAGETYEIVITNFHGGSLVRYRIGDAIKITALNNETTGCKLPQMVFEQRVDGMLDFVVVRLTEKTIWEAIEHTGITYEDWIAYKEPGKPVLKLFIELKNGCRQTEKEIAAAIHGHFYKSESDDIHADSPLRQEFSAFVDFKVDVSLLSKGTFANFMAKKQAEGADLAHIKPPHINPAPEVLSMVTGEREEIVAVKKTRKLPEKSSVTDEIDISG
jgi:hypothetical protein